MAYENCYRVCGDRSELVLRKIGYRYSNVLLDKRRAIEHAIRQDIKFSLDVSRGTFGVSRYSDGTWPVLYTATEDSTSIHEVAYHARREWLGAMVHGRPPSSYRLSKKLLYVLEIKLASQQVHSSFDARFISSDYTYCHGIAASARAAGYGSVKVPSARKHHGTCVPVFDRSAVKAKASMSAHFTIRWYPVTDRLVHLASNQRSPREIDLWHR